MSPEPTFGPGAKGKCIRKSDGGWRCTGSGGNPPPPPGCFWYTVKVCSAKGCWCATHRLPAKACKEYEADTEWGGRESQSRCVECKTFDPTPRSDNPPPLPFPARFSNTPPQPSQGEWSNGRGPSRLPPP